MALLCTLLLVIPFGIRTYQGRTFFPGAAPTLSWQDGASLLMFAAAVYLAVFRNALVPERLLRPAGSAVPISPATPHFVPLVAAASAVIVSALMILSPSLFRELTLEDGWIESLTFALLLLSAVLVFYFGRRLGEDRLSRAAAYLLALLLLFAAMEEISWGQRLFGIATPEYLRQRNWQHELNLHNLNSRASNAVFYFSSFVFLVAVPFIHDRTLLFERYLRPLTPLVGGGLTLFTGCVAMALNNHYWNSPFSHFAFLASLAILVYYLLRRPFSPVLGGFVAMLAVSAGLCLYGYGYLIDKFRLYEYKEFYFALGYCSYGVERLAWTRRHGVNRSS